MVLSIELAHGKYVNQEIETFTYDVVFFLVLLY